MKRKRLASPSGAPRPAPVARAGTPPDPDFRQRSAANAPEIIIGLVTPLGVPAEAVADRLGHYLEAEVAYRAFHIHVVEHLVKEGRISIPPTKRGLKAITAKIDAGNEICERLRRKDAMALHAIRLIFQQRWAAQRRQAPAVVSASDIRHLPRTAYIVRSLKRPEEIHTLRRVYGPWVIIVGVFATPKTRQAAISQQLVDAGHPAPESEIEGLLLRDAKEALEYGQNSRAAFAEADFFVDVAGNMEQEIQRFVRLVFGDRTFTPNRREYGMFHARAAALRSSSPALQVGAAICDSHGELISAGTNEVPKALGGYPWDVYPDAPGRSDQREIGLPAGQLFPEIVRKRELLREAIELMLPLMANAEVRKFRRDPTAYVDGLRTGELKRSQLINLIEFQRTVHAEMAAILNAQRHGSSVYGATLFTTSFPCHVCAKHILAAGIRRVLYVEPYPKSRAYDLYPTEISLDDSEERTTPARIPFQQFMGIAPRLYLRVFHAIGSDRLTAEGTIAKWAGGAMTFPRLGSSDESYLSRAATKAIRVAELSVITLLWQPEQP